ncbi:MAG: PAS domain-containing sensor histidine kinase, partial [Segetibacter sp.]
GIWMLDENSKTTFVNQKMCEIMGYSSDEMMGKTNFFFKDEAGLQASLSKLERRRQGITETYKSSFVTKDGRLIWTQISSNPIFDDAEEYQGSLWMVSDITEKLMADKMLLESEQKYRTLASELDIERTRLVTAQAVAKVGSWETDLQTLQVNWSEETHGIFGTDPKSFPATHAAFLKFIHPDDRAKVDAAFIDSLGKTASNSIGHRIVTTEGLVKLVLENWVVFNDENGIPVRAVGTCQDITEKKKLEDLLDKANNLARIGSYEVDLQKNTLYWSDITKQIHEVESDFIPDVETALDFYKAGTSRNLIVSAMKDALENNTPLDLELQIVTAKGNERWVKVIGEAICIDGKCIRLYGSFQDIDKLKNAEIKIRESEFCYRQIVETAQEGVWLIDEHNKTTFVNSKMCEILGYEVNEMMGKEIYEFMDAKGIEIAKDLMKKKKQGHAGHDKFRYISKSGKEVWTKVSANPLFNEDDSYKGALAMVTDITLEMQHEKEIRKNTEERELLIRELTKSLHDLKQFSFITSHNFRAPLSNLVGLLTLLDYSTLSESNKEIVKMFETTTNQLNKTINDLIKILIVRNNVNVNITENNISIILNEVCNTLAYNLEEAKCTIHTNLEVEVIAFNQLYLQSILMNLLTNAIKYRSADRQLQINISTTRDAAGKVMLVVNDNGVGIDLTRHGDNIFGLYQRFHSNEDGEGLELFIVKSQITALGGSIHVESEVDKGTSFTMTFKDKVRAAIVGKVPVIV